MRSPIIFLVFLLPLALCSYSPSESLELWYYNTAAYCLPARIQNWNVSHIQTLYPQIQDIKVYQYTPTDNLAYLAYNPLSNLIFLSFRGTMDLSIINWISDFNVTYTTVSYPSCLLCYVHGGFHTAYNNLNPTQMMNDLAALHAKYPSARIAITGHSLGGAMATFAFIDAYHKLGSDINVPVDIYTFGGPRVGNGFFVNYFKNLNFANGDKWRVTHFMDPVPQVPPTIMGFGHCFGEIFYVDSSSFKQCNGFEDLGCQAGIKLISWNPADHVIYLGFNQQAQMLTCMF